MKKHITTIIAVVFYCSFSLKAQDNVAINATGTSPDASAMLDVSSITKGVLLPRMTETQMLAIPSPAEGLMLFNTSTGCLSVYVGGEWTSICGTAAPKIIFVSDATSNGNIGGPLVADAICQSEATAEGLFGTFKAILTSGTTEMLDRLGAAPTDYDGGVKLPSGTVVADNWLMLTANPVALLSAVNEKADGTVVPTTEVWSGFSNVSAGLSINGSDCSDWTNAGSGSSGRHGRSDFTNNAWISYTSSSCAEVKPFYCIQQP